MSEQILTPDPLEAELIALGRTLVIDPPSADLAARVMTQISETDGEYAGSADSRIGSTFSSWLDRLRARRRRAAAVAVAALLVVVLVPPVRAAVLELFRIGGVTVREVPTPSGVEATTGSAPTTSGSIVVGSLAEASDRVGFDVTAPAQLGSPTSIAVTREGRVVELTWGTGPDSTRLDIFKGSLSFGYLKSVWQAVTPTDVAGQEAVWFAGTHLIEWTDRSGVTVASAPRVAGPTLVWVDRDRTGRELTYRLEGPKSLEAATTIAESAR
ncbi:MULTISPECIES: hypothetical protein [unclassified Knoellia]|uniref:hypothetical protein n=1 Tax=Knoellia altitudinis TaxID=3404795 RepID=UPI00360C5DCC